MLLMLNAPAKDYVTTRRVYVDASQDTQEALVKDRLALVAALGMVAVSRWLNLQLSQLQYLLVLRLCMMMSYRIKLGMLTKLGPVFVTPNGQWGMLRTKHKSLSGTVQTAACNPAPLATTLPPLETTTHTMTRQIVNFSVQMGLHGKQRLIQEGSPATTTLKGSHCVATCQLNILT
jgi:hypothetical protein